MNYNHVRQVVETYAGEVDGKDTWQTVYDPKIDPPYKLDHLIRAIQANERSKFLLKLNKFIKEI